MSVAMSGDRRGRVPTVWTRRLQVLTAVGAVIFATGTIVHGVLMGAGDIVAHSMRLAGVSPAEAADSTAMWSSPAAGITAGAVFLVANLLGVFALRGWTWVYWFSIVFWLIQGIGMLVSVPPEVFQALVDKFGLVGPVPILVCDQGGLLVALVLIGFFVRFRTPWARRRVSQPSTAGR